MLLLFQLLVLALLLVLVIALLIFMVEGHLSHSASSFADAASAPDTTATCSSTVLMTGLGCTYRQQTRRSSDLPVYASGFPPLKYHFSDVQQM